MVRCCGGFRKEKKTRPLSNGWACAFKCRIVRIWGSEKADVMEQKGGLREAAAQSGVLQQQTSLVLLASPLCPLEAPFWVLRFLTLVALPLSSAPLQPFSGTFHGAQGPVTKLRGTRVDGKFTRLSR